MVCNLNFAKKKKNICILWQKNKNWNSTLENKLFSESCKRRDDKWWKPWWKWKQGIMGTQSLRQWPMLLYNLHDYKLDNWMHFRLMIYPPLGYLTACFAWIVIGGGNQTLKHINTLLIINPFVVVNMAFWSWFIKFVIFDDFYMYPAWSNVVNVIGKHLYIGGNSF